VGLLDRLDALDRRVLPAKWREPRPWTPQRLRRAKRGSLVAAWVLVAFAVLDALTSDWVGAVVLGVIGGGMVLTNRRYWAWIARWDRARRGGPAAAFVSARPQTATLTAYLCWHGGEGHDYPAEVMQAANRLRGRHGDTNDDDYITLTFAPSSEDWDDFLLIAPYCDLAYATDRAGAVVAQTPP
jgi:hypothetical protein